MCMYAREVVSPVLVNSIENTRRKCRERASRLVHSYLVPITDFAQCTMQAGYASLLLLLVK